MLLHLTFDVIKEDYIVLENLNGSAKCVPFDDLLNFYENNPSLFANIEIIIIASPDGEK